jgi:hypothetical protein
VQRHNLYRDNRTHDEYKRARRRPTVFVVVPGHERPEIENVVGRARRSLKPPG